MYNCIRRLTIKTRHVEIFQPYQSRFSLGLPFCNMSTNSGNQNIEMFRAILPSVITLAKSNRISKLPKCSTWVQKILEYNLTGGKTTRGLMTIAAYESAEKPENITQESIKKACILGWCTEIFHAGILMLDDIMEGSTTRHGKPCWYALPDVGLGGIKDAILLNGCIYEVLKPNFGDNPHYLKMVELFDDALLYSAMGEHVDHVMAHRFKQDYNLFTMDRYTSIAKYKAGHYTFRLPIRLGYILANKIDESLLQDMDKICLDLGTMYQIQNDMMDCFGDEALTGKKGNDIEEGKCTWLSVNALRLCSAAQRAEFVHNYAHSDPARVQAVKQLYEDLNLKELYHEEERNVYETIKKSIYALPNADRKLFLDLLNKIYKRKQ